MYAVIFDAEINQLDEAYRRTAERLRRLALEEFDCREFLACSEGGREIAISYWESLDDIRRWRDHDEHRAAQQAGRDSWYRSYRVQLVTVDREYRVNR